MRKISNSFTRKRGIFSLLAVVALFLVGIGVANAAKWIYEDDPVSVSYSSTGEKYIYNCMQDKGVLTVTLEPATGFTGVNYGPGTGNTYILYQGTTGSTTPAEMIEVNKPDRGDGVCADVTVAKFSVEFGDYYIQLPYYEGKVTITLQEGDDNQGGGEGDGGGDVVTEAKLPVDNGTLTIKWDDSEKYYYTPNADGVLSMTSNGTLGYNGYLLFTADGNGVEFAEFTKDEWTPTVHVKSAKWNLKGGQKYYFQNTGGDDGKVLTFTYDAGGNAGGEGDGGNQGGDVDADGWETAVIGNTYNAQTAEGQVLTLKLTTKSAGSLVINQTGGTDAVVFEAPTKNTDDYANMVSNEYTGNTCTYRLSGGQTYYIYVEYNPSAYKTIRQIELVSYSGVLEGEDVEVPSLPVLPNEVKTVIAPFKVYQYTCEAEGKLSIEVDSYSTSFGMLPDQQYFVFTNESCSKAAKALKADDGKVLKGWRVEFDVQPGEVYYVKNDDFDTHTFYASLEAGAGVVAKLVDAQPLPGAAIDNSSYEATLTIQFEPTKVDIQSVDFVFTNKQGELQTIKNVSCELLGGSYNIPKPQYMTVDGKRYNDPGEGSTSTDVVVSTLISTADGAVQKYVLNKVTYKGKPVAESDITKGVEIAEDGTITLNYVIDSPTTIDEATSYIPETFYMSWEKGDKAGIAVLNYTKPLNTEDPVEVNIMEGRQVYGSEPGENDVVWSVPAERITVTEKTITIDFTGEGFAVCQNPGDPEWGPANPDTSYITLYVGNVTGQNGLGASYNGAPAYMPQIPYVAEVAEVPEPEVPAVISIVPANGEALSMNADGSATFEINFATDSKITKAGFWNARNNNWTYVYTTEPANTEYAKTWKVTMPKEYVETVAKDVDPDAKVWAYIKAEDKDGQSVPFGDNAYEGWGDCDFYLCYTIQHEAPGMDFTTSLEEGDNEAPLRSFTVASEYGKLKGNNQNQVYPDGTYINPFTSIEVKGPNGFTANAVEFIDGEQSVVLDKSIVEAGQYTIYFPFQAFTIINSGNGLTDEIYDSQEKTVEFTVVLGDKIYDSQIPNIFLTTEPAHEETAEAAENAEPVSTEEITDIYLTWNERNLEIVEDKDGGVTVTGPNGYFADYSDAAHQYSIEGNKFVLNLDGIVAEIQDLINSQAEGMDASAYNGVYRFTIKKNTIKIEGSNARAIEEPVYNDEAHLFYNLNFADAVAVKDQIVFDHTDFYPKYNVKYYFTPMNNGTLQWTVYENNAPTTTYVMGGIYSAETDELVAPSKLNGTDWGWAYQAESAEYYLLDHKEYYFVWTKNETSDDYSLLVTWVPDLSTGVAGIEAVNGVYKVYNLQGVNVLNTENAADLNGLAKGLYIVNGKKMLVK